MRKWTSLVLTIACFSAAVWAITCMLDMANAMTPVVEMAYNIINLR